MPGKGQGQAQGPSSPHSLTPVPPQNAEEQNSQFQSLEQVKRRPAHLMALLQHVALQFEPGPLVRMGLGQARVVSVLWEASENEPGGSRNIQKADLELGSPRDHRVVQTGLQVPG